MSKLPLDKSPGKIESMFDEISTSYDKLNHLFTMRMDIRWRRNIVSELIRRKVPVSKILDIASGTGDLTIELMKLNAHEIFATDISSKMLEIQKMKISDKRVKMIKADVNELPLEDNYFDIITIGFGVRNFPDLPHALNEIKRVLKKDGMLIVLEMFKRDGLFIKLFNLYFGKVMPWVGNKISKSSYAYSYLFESVDKFLSVEEFSNLAEKEGYELVLKKDNFLGIVNSIYLIKK